MFGRSLVGAAAEAYAWISSAAAHASAGVERSLKEFICLLCVEPCVNAVVRKTLAPGFAHYGGSNPVWHRGSVSNTVLAAVKLRLNTLAHILRATLAQVVA